MIQILKKQGWLVMAAALTIGLSACSNDDVSTDGQPQASSPKTIRVTVGAGIDDAASTRSAVVYDETAKTRTLTFTAGDRLFVQGGLGELQIDENNYGYYNYKIAGYLSMVEGSLSADGKSAKFTGDLYLLTSKKVEYGEGDWAWYNYEYEKDEDATYDFEGKDPLSVATDVVAYLVHEDAIEDKDVVATDGEIYYPLDWAADVKTLMTTKMTVGSNDEYDAESKSFSLYNWAGPIFNCAFSGLKPNTSYELHYCPTSSDGYIYEDWVQTPIKTDVTGKATFAIFAGAWYSAHAYKFIPLSEEGYQDYNGEVMMVDLGSPELEYDMVYNVVRNAVLAPVETYNAIETPGDGGIW